MIDFAKVEQEVRALNRRLKAREIDQETFKTRLMELVDVGEDGYYWMFGHKSEIWYRHNGAKWVADDPGEIVVSPPGHNNPGNPHPDSTATSTDQEPFDWNWFIASLLLITLVGWVVFIFTALSIVN